MDDLIRVTPDKEKARSLLSMANTTLEMMASIDEAKFPSNMTKEYYEVIKDLMLAVASLDGIKTVGEGAHKKLIEYIQRNYRELKWDEISLMDDMRMTRNKIAYEGFFVQPDFIARKKHDILLVIEKPRSIITGKL